MCNSDGATVWHAAFSNPSSGPGNTMRRCDVDVVRLLLSRGLVVSDLKTWHNAEPGTRIFTGSEDNCYVTVLVHLQEEYASSRTCRGFWRSAQRHGLWRIYMDRKARRERTKLLPVVVHVSAALGRSSLRNGNMFDMRTAQTWDSALDWSFPPHWRNSMVALALCLGRRVPRLDGNVLANIVDCCGRAWFLNLKRERDRQRKRILGSGGRPPLRAKLLAKGA